jgi:hypothetical protein
VLGALLKLEMKISVVSRALSFREPDIFLTELSGVRVVKNVAVSDPSPYEQMGLKFHDRVNLLGAEEVKRINGRSWGDQVEPLSIVTKIPIVESIVNIPSLLHADVYRSHHVVPRCRSRILEMDNQASNRIGWTNIRRPGAGPQSKTGIVDKSTLNGSKSFAIEFVRRFHCAPLSASEPRIDSGYKSDDASDGQHSFLVSAHLGGRLLGIALAFAGMLLIYRGLLGDRSLIVCILLAGTGWVMCFFATGLLAGTLG